MTSAGLSTRASAISAAGTVLSQPTMQTSASKSCAMSISSIESAISSRETSDARIPGVACVWLSETAMVLKDSATPPASVTPRSTAAARSRWLRLQGMVCVHIDETPTIAPSRRSGSMPIARKCERAAARSSPWASSARALRRAAAVKSESELMSRGIVARRAPAASWSANRGAQIDRAVQRDGLEQLTVVGDEQHGAVVGVQRGLELLDRRQVEVVRGLVEHEPVRAGGHQQ